MSPQSNTITIQNIFDSTPKLHAPELDRLAALRHMEVLDTPNEPEFDELVQFAAALCDAPVSLLTLLDERRQWFKASFGLDLQQTPREVAFCHHTIQQSSLMLVKDSTLDERFARNPLVINDPHVRFYAGVPVCSPDGYPLGSLCVLDFVPRTLTDLQTKALRLLSQQVNARLHLRQQRLHLTKTLDATRQANLQLQKLATTDPLTGLFNRRSFEERLFAECARALQDDLPLSVLLIDVDNFKQLNDRFGHDAGDEALRLLASLLRQLTPAHGMPVRYGGEEFLILLPRTAEPEAADFAFNLLDAVRNRHWPNRQITVSIGSASLSPLASTPDRLVRLADEALYIAKRSGKDRLVSHGTYFDLCGSSAQLGIAVS